MSRSSHRSGRRSIAPAASLLLLVLLVACRQPQVDDALPTPGVTPTAVDSTQPPPTSTSATPTATATATGTVLPTLTPPTTTLPTVVPTTPIETPTTPSLFANETTGVTDSKIVICGHAPLTGAAPIARDPSQTNVYWSWLNASGGINGRTVEPIIFDDRYTPDGAISAAEKCRANHKAFLVNGVAGVDQITAVASWAERNKIPYLHGAASTGSIGENPYQFFLAPDYETQSRMLADYIVNVLKKDKVAMIRLDSPHFEGPGNAFKARLAEHGISLTADITVTADQQNFPYSSQLADAEVVNNFTNPLTWLKITSQLGQSITPYWVAISPIASLNLVPTTLGPFLGGRARVFSATPLFADDPSLSYYAEVDRFLDAFVRYTGRARSSADDVDWIAWLTNRQIAEGLRAAGRNLTRSSLVAALESLEQTGAEASPSCRLDFTRDPDSPNRRGAWNVNLFVSAGSVWAQEKRCASRF